MDGEVIYFDADRGIGFITGRDGNRYVFDRADIIGDDRVAKGAKIRFSVDGDHARAIEHMGPRPASARANAVPSPLSTAQGSVPSVAGGDVDTPAQEPGPAPGMFAHFRRCLTARYANFRDRATRKEYWSFVLFSMIALVVLGIAGFMVDAAMGNEEEPVLTIVLVVIYALALIIPGLAVTVRRIHDIGLSGWFILLNFIPSIGALIIFVFTLIPSQKHPNKWGSVPAGIRV